jgi:hypothetical protein
MSAKNAQNPAGAVQGAAQAGTVGAPVEEAIEKVIGEEVVAAISRAANSLTGQNVGDGSLDGAAKAVIAAGGGQFIDPSLSQYKENLVLYFDPEHSIVKEVEVGRGGNNTTYCVTVPAGMAQPDNSVVFNKAFNAYISTFRKEIRVHDENGEPVLDPTKNNEPVVVNGGTNQVWNEMRGYSSVGQMLGAMSGRKFKCVKILRNFGPSNYVGNEGERRPTGHRLTSLPLFEEI